jgi:hypothetical protein
LSASELLRQARTPAAFLNSESEDCALAEHPFGTIKRWFGYTYFPVKGLAMVRAEWTLITLCYNLKRVLNIVSFAELMAAVQKSAARPA